MEAKIENHQIVVTVIPGDVMDGNVNIPVGSVIRKTLAKHEVEKLLGKPQGRAGDARPSDGG